MFNNMNSGYTGYSMSKRAAEAYQNGERPLSKWTKKDIINEIKEYASDNNLPFSIALLNKVKAKVLKDSLLKETSWHHTSSFANSFASLTPPKPAPTITIRGFLSAIKSPPSHCSL